VDADVRRWGTVSTAIDRISGSVRRLGKLNSDAMILYLFVLQGASGRPTGETKGGKPYLRITESHKGAGDKFERNSINVFPEDADEFAQAVSEMASKLE
jgi:hypothetical protein